MITFRFFGLALIFPAMLLMGNWLSFLVPVAVIYGIGLLLVMLLDRRAAGRADQFRIERVHDSKLSLGAPNRIVIRVRSRARRSVDLIVRDEVPLLFSGSEEAELHHTLEAQENIDLDYHVRPLKRGDYRFGDLNIRWSSPLNFYTRQAVIPAEIGVKVYPNLHEIRKYDLLVRRDQLAEMGLKNVRLRGEGTQFESLRDYTHDDPYRSINWKATARRGKPISTDFEPERSQRVMIALDIGRMMRSPIRVDDPDGISWNMSKVDFVLNSVLLFSYVATQKGDQVGLLLFADNVRQYIAPQGGRAHFQKLLDMMYGVDSQPAEADYGQALNYLRNQNKKRSLVVIFTDLSGSRATDALIKYVPTLAPRHLPMLVTIRDPALDQEAELIPSSSDFLYRRAVAEQLIDERRLLLEHLQRRGVITLDVDAEDMTM
ncbi:MAG TPA: DUF58 domain-containing protein, partial [Aggregatilineales bacterium]|nr:DUF58 domain-containing protein [Aggregatilineales bacterium]